MRSAAFVRVYDLCVGRNEGHGNGQVTFIQKTLQDIVFLSSVYVKVMMQNFSFNLDHLEIKRVECLAVYFVAGRWHK